MRYTNRHFTYLLTYLLTRSQWSVTAGPVRRPAGLDNVLYTVPVLNVRSRWIIGAVFMSVCSYKPSICPNKKLSCRRETVRRLVSLNISLSHSRSFEVAPFDRSRTSSYWRSIVTVALSCMISEIKRDIDQLKSRHPYRTCIRSPR